MDAMRLDRPGRLRPIRSRSGTSPGAERFGKLGEAVMTRFDAMPGYLRRLARLGVVGACLGGPVGFGFVAATSARAQQGVEVGIQRTYVNTPYVKLPIEIEPAQRAQLKGLVLFMKEGTQAGWTR